MVEMSSEKNVWERNVWKKFPGFVTTLAHQLSNIACHPDALSAIVTVNPCCQHK
jgi:hypothetical protein